MESPLERFAANALDWPEVRALLERHAASSVGKRALLELAPRAPDEARAALRRTRELFELGAGVEPPLSGLSDPRAPLEEAARYSRALDGQTLVVVARFLRLVEDLGHWLAGRREVLAATAALWVGLPNLSGLREMLEKALDEKGKLVADASPLLAKLTARIDKLDRSIERHMHQLAHRTAWKASLAEGHFGSVHYRNGRRVLAVRQRHAGRVPGIVHDRSQTGETIFVEPREVVESANVLSAAQADREREEARILGELTRAVLLRRDALLLCLERTAELELAVIGARYARAVSGHPPRLPGEPGAAGGLLLRRFRHPLLLEEASAEHIDEVVPLDLRLGEDFSLLVITGPNTGGKTLAIKSAGLACLMTSMGLPLPCDAGTTVPLFDGIVADIGDEQEIRQNLSTFSSHLRRIHRGVLRATPRTLFLLDELGGGTDPSEGAALGEAILEHLLREQVPTLASTHLGKLKEFAFRFQRAENAHVEFDLETLAPRYRLVIGAPGESRALAIARRLGFPEELVALAGERLERTDGEANELMDELREVRLGAERHRSKAEEKLIHAERRLEDLAERHTELDQKGAQLEAEAQRGIEERLRRARGWLEKLEGFLHQVPVERRAPLEEILHGFEEALAEATLSDRRKAFVASLKKGAEVFLPRFKKRCTVTRIYKDKREIEVKMGKHSMRVGFDDVTFYESL